MRNKLLLTCSVVLLCLCSLVSFAQKEPVYMDALIGNNLHTGKRLAVKDTVFFDGVLKPTINNTYSIDNIISLRINEDETKVFPDSFKLDVTIKVKYTAPDTLSDSVNTKVLSIDYNKFHTTYNHRAIYQFKTAHYVDVEILSIAGTYADTSVILPLTLLENRMVINRDYLMRCTNDAINTLHADTSTISTVGELKVSWTPNGVSQFYDVEWTYIDKSAIDNGKYDVGGSLSIDKIFKNNATRITTKADTCMIPLLYDGEGYLYYRVRGTQIDATGEILATKWSSEVDPVSTNWRYSFNGHERPLNWQASISFAEEGKRKAVVQYFDGSLKGRQTVTKDNTTGTTIVAETLYDKQGRPVIQVMPAPTLSTLIKYNPLFNVHNMAGNEYDKSVYDTLYNSSDYCGTRGDSMSVVSGATQYYSPLNPLVSEGFHKYIPDAKGYAFVQTQYTQDNTGRIFKQGGVGETFRLHDSIKHQTWYFYENAKQYELDALFGTEVGAASHYQKNIVRDPNGQYSVSYVDMHGRTIATALAGPVPSAFDTLESFRDSTETAQLLDETNNLIDGISVKHTSSLTMYNEGEITLHYSMGKNGLSLKDCKDSSICYDCLYNLEIKIVGDCSNGIDGVNDTLIKLSNFSLWRLDTTCNLAVPIDTSITLHLQEGGYNIFKTLSISKLGMDKFRDSVYLPHNTCKSFEDFYNEQLAIIRDSLDCSSDTLSVPTYASYREQMLLDMYPLLGQYGDTAKARSCFSIFDVVGNKYNYQLDTTTCYKNQLGNCDSVENSQGLLVPPTKLTPEEFIANFKSSWAEKLLPLHPEYPLLVEYEKFATSHLFDDDFEATQTFVEAKAKGYLNPTNSTTQAPANSFPGATDPLYGYTFFNAAAVKQKILDSLTMMFATGDVTHPYISAWGLATAVGKCDSSSDLTCVLHWDSNVFDSANLCVGDLDMAWKIFRAIYLQKKRAWMENYIHSVAGVAYPHAPCNPVFPKLDSVLASAGLTVFGTSSNQATVGSTANQASSDFCESYRELWRQQLGNTCYSEDQKDSIINELVKVCKGTTNFEHPFGASTNSSYSRFHNFKAVFEYFNQDTVFDIHGETCNEYLLSQPYPYDQPSDLLSNETWQKPDSCTCARINSLYSLYVADSTKYFGFSDYIYQTQHTTISNGALDSLRALCDGTINCKFIAKPLIIPPALQCGMSGVCINCSQMQVAFDSFRVKFPTIVPTLEELDTTQVLINRVFANYMNHYFGFTKSAQDYLNFMHNCGQGLDNYSDSLWTTVKNFQSLYSAVSQGQVFGQYKITPGSHAIIDGANALVKKRTNQTLPSGYALTASNSGFTSKLRHVFETTGSSPKRHNTIVPLPLDNTLTGTTFSELEGNVVDANDFAASPVTAAQLGRKYFATSLMEYDSCYRQIWNKKYSTAYVYYGSSTPPLKYLPDATSSFSGNDIWTMAFFKIHPTVTTASGFNSFYNDSVLFNSYYRHYVYPTDSIRTIKNLRFATEFMPSPMTTNFEFSARGLKVTLELIDNREVDAYWFTTYDAQTYVKFKEIIDSNLYNANCQQAFTYYFNQEFATSFSSSQIDSILTAHNVPLIYCNSESAGDSLLCGKIELPDSLIAEPGGPCADSINLAIIAATQLYQYYQDSLSNHFNEVYTRKCLNVSGLESLELTKPSNEYHFTLYYYDQAGNVVKTVPPEGVDARRRQTWYDSVKVARATGEWLGNDHGLKTTYRYNSLNQVVSQKSPDGGYSEFWYDRLGRLVVSQNSKQRPNSKFSYTKYDAIGRIVEVGEKLQDYTVSQSITRDPIRLQKWLYYRGSEFDYFPKQVTITSYDVPSGYEAVFGYFTPFRQKSYTLRNRVSWTRYYDYLYTNFYMPPASVDTVWTHDFNYFNTGIEYSYDIHGNVDSLLNIASVGSFMSDFGGNAYKYIAYKYDLISGKVNEVHYQGSSDLFPFADEFYHRYEYDADNKLTDVYTTNNKTFIGQNGLEEHDAHYEYYKHGPLARIVISQQQVQGVDYAYTLQGWLKGVNSTSLSSDFDMGEDGKNGGSNKFVAKDVYGFNLNYFTPQDSLHGDYLPINSGHTPFPQHAYAIGSEHRQLYNGNITSMAVNIGKFSQPQLYNYRYDQLNRIKRMDVYRGLNEGTNSWSAIAMVNDYKERVSYDGNGNIKSYTRNGFGATLGMDSLSYSYIPGTNQLDHVDDPVSSGNYSVDIDDQASANYRYDAIGNLIHDEEGRIDTVTWNVYGKITNIGRINGPLNEVGAIDYRYDPSGNRVGKVVSMYGGTEYFKKKTWYVRDAQGNVMAVYDATVNTSWNQGPLFLREHHIYGSSRLGIIQRSQNMDSLKVYSVTEDLINATYLTQEQRGLKDYELSNHLGNVLATISDKRFGQGNTSGNYNYYYADVVTSNDYYPFGMMMPGRTFSAESSYRYGFNGKENDNEVKGEGNQQDYGMRVYDPRLGKFLSVDPLTNKYPWYTPYQFAGNLPIWAIDLDGAEPAPGDANYGANIIFGSDKMVSAVMPTTRNTDNENWIAFRYYTLADAKLKLSTLKASGIKVKTVYLQMHGNPSGPVIANPPTPDVKMDIASTCLPQDECHVPGETVAEMDFQQYQRLQQMASSKKKRERENAAKGLSGQQYEDGGRTMEGLNLQSKEAIDNLISIANEIEEGGTLVLGGCLIAGGVYGDRMLTLISNLVKNRVAIYGNTNYTAGPTAMETKRGGKVTSIKYSILDQPMSHPAGTTDVMGWKMVPARTNIVSTTNSDIQLSSKGDSIQQIPLKITQ